FDVDAVSSVTVSKDTNGHYHASLILPAPTPTPPKSQAVSGIDLGLTDLVAGVSSDGTRSKTPAPRHYRRAFQHPARRRRDPTRKKRGSRNRAKAKARLARKHKRVADTRRDFLHNLTTAMADKNHAVAVEDLGVSGMARAGMGLSTSIYDAS